MNIITIGLIIISLTYATLILSYAYYFTKLNIHTPNCQIENHLYVSIIIPARNESNCILNLLQTIKNQNYPYKYFEIIIIDDASTDNTYQVVQQFASQNPEINCIILRIEDDTVKPTYKKYAISKAIKISKGDLIVTTDADCIVGPDWITGIVCKYNKTKAKIMPGLVAYHKDEDSFQKMQHLEFLSLIASGAAAVEAGFPIMCNGANLVYEKKAFESVNGFDANDQFASGDDVFLLLKLKKKYGSQCISVLNNKNTIVYTQAKENLTEFTQQRIRWVSKTRGYKDVSIILVAGIVFLLNAGIVFSFMMGFVYPDFLLLSLYLFLIKVIVDFPILLAITSFLNRKDLLAYYLPLQLVYLPYVLIIGTIGNFLSYQWKGRRINK
jgi:cellulose synthase/poly-beta-1,6-N-acetylglucosamine synthase-like glycosyltransferase